MELKNLAATVAPQPVHIFQIVTVICDELHAALFVGWGTRRAIEIADATESSMFVNRLDFKRNEIEKGCTPFPVVHALSLEALGSVKQWAKDVGAFYNNDLLHEAVVDLIADWFHAGYDATNLEPAIESLSAYIEKAQTYDNGKWFAQVNGGQLVA